MLQLCVWLDIEYLGSLESTQEARVARGAILTLLSGSPNFPRAQYLDICTLTRELIVKNETTVHILTWYFEHHLNFYYELPSKVRLETIIFGELWPEISTRTEESHLFSRPKFPKILAQWKGPLQSSLDFLSQLRLRDFVARSAFARPKQLAPLSQKLVRSTCGKPNSSQVNCINAFIIWKKNPLVLTATSIIFKSSFFHAMSSDSYLYSVRFKKLWMDKIALKTFTSNSRKLSW